MRILIVYASTEGQTQKICCFAFHRLTAGVHSVALVAADASHGIDPGGFDAAILAASIHAGRYQKSLIEFATRHATALNEMKSLFLSVSLAAAGEDETEWADLERIASEFSTETGWSPSRVEHVAGAFRFGEYDFFKAWAMRWIESQKDSDVRPGTDKEYTDWPKLEAILDAWSD